MNDDERIHEIEFIREEQAKLRRQMARLEQLIDALSTAESTERPAEKPAPFVRTAPAAPFLPPSVPTQDLPPPIPIMAKAPPQPVQIPRDVPPSVPVIPPPAATPPPISPPRQSLEVEIGTVWLVRIGIVFLLTSLAFGGGYIYQHVIPRLGPLAKVVLLYLAAGGLTGVGAWLERKKEDEPAHDAPAKGGLRQYAQVVLAGGLAAVYYVTYAAHWNPNLRVVESPLLAGVLLLGWTAFMVYIAHRRASETLATFAILLAYYTSAINGIEAFTLFANLALAIAAVFLLRRHLWTIFPFASLLATFGSYGFWRYFHVYSAVRGVPASASPIIGTGGFWIEGTFLLIYWLLFTWVILAPGVKALARVSESSFAGLNNGAFFALTAWALRADYPGTFWQWALGFGAVQLALAELGRRLPNPLDKRTEGTYQSGGVLLITWGIIAYLNGWQLSFALALESTALTFSAGRRGSRLFAVAAAAVAILATLKVFADYYWLHVGAPPTWVADIASGALLVFNAWWGQKLCKDAPPSGHEPLIWERFRGTLQQSVGLFSTLGCVIWATTMLHHIDNGLFLAPSLVLAAVGLTALAHFLRIGSLAVCAQAYLALALGEWNLNRERSAALLDPLPIWNPLLVFVGILAVGHWWQRKYWVKLLASPFFNVMAIVDAVFAVLVLAWWLQPADLRGTDIWVAESAALALLFLVYGLATRYEALALTGQYFQVASVLAVGTLYSGYWDRSWTEPLLTLAPILGGIAFLAVLNLWLPPAVGALMWRKLVANIIYEAVTVVLMIAWGNRYFPHTEKFTLFCLLGAAIFAIGVWKKEVRWLYWSGLVSAVALFDYIFVYSRAEEADWIHWLGIAILAGQQQLGRRKLTPEKFPSKAQGIYMVSATVIAWIWVSMWVSLLSIGGIFTLAAGWSLFAVIVFAAGFLWRESVYRRLGLIILACTLGRIVVYDIWQLDSLGRILSSAALGLVLLGIAFAYIKFQKQLRNWF